MVSLNNKSFYDHFGGGDRTKNGITKQNTILRVSTKLPRGNWRMKNLTKRMEKIVGFVLWPQFFFWGGRRQLFFTKSHWEFPALKIYGNVELKAIISFATIHHTQMIEHENSISTEYGKECHANF